MLISLPKAVHTLFFINFLYLVLAINTSIQAISESFSPKSNHFSYTIQISLEASYLIEELEPLVEKLKEPRKKPSSDVTTGSENTSNEALILEALRNFENTSNEAIVFEALRTLVKKRTMIDKAINELLSAELVCLEAFFYLSSSCNFDLLEYTLRKGSKVLVERLIRNFKISPSLKDSHGDPILFYAIRHGNLEAVKYLVEQGASVRELNSKNETVLDEIDKYSDSKNEDDRKTFSAMRKFLRDEKAFYSPKKQDFKNYLLAGLVADGSCKESIEKLLKYDKVEINTKTHSTGCTPLMLAAQRGLPDIVSLLLRHGARPGDTNLDGLNAEVLAKKALTKLIQQLKEESLTRQQKEQNLKEQANYEKVLELLANIAESLGFAYIFCEDPVPNAKS